jgi:hypothetical protein
VNRCVTGLNGLHDLEAALGETPRIDEPQAITVRFCRMKSLATRYR